MTEIIIFTALTVEMSIIVDNLKKACQEYEKEPDKEESTEKIRALCQLFIAKCIIGNDPKKALKFLKEVNDMPGESDILKMDLN